MSEELQEKKALDVKKLLKSVLAYGSSDLHLVVGSEPQIRIDKELRPLNLAVLSAKDVEEMAYSLIEDKQKKAFEEQVVFYRDRINPILAFEGDYEKFRDACLRKINVEYQKANRLLQQRHNMFN